MADVPEEVLFAADKLRRDLASSKQDTFEEGTVISWVHMGSGHTRYLFAALKATDGTWYLTGTSSVYGVVNVSYEKLLTILNRRDTNDIMLAGSWETI